MRKLLFFLLIPALFFGCKKTDQAKIDQQIIQNYIDSNHLNAVAEPNGLYMVTTMAGTGAYPTSTSTVTVTYKGYLTNGSVFDQSATAVSFALTDVIAGWQEGIPLMRKGSKATFLIPSALGYGNQATGPIPANSVLIFDVTLLNFQ